MAYDVNGQDKADLRYLSTLLGNARTHLEDAQGALATATAWTAIMLGAKTTTAKGASDVGLIFRRIKRLDDKTNLYVSGRGASLSRRVGRRLRFNSRRSGSFQIGGRGISWRFGRRR
jgi:hypothetical protein